MIPSSDPPSPDVLITRRATFAAAHRYENPAWSPERNREVFGACYNPHGHGHNYDLEVTVSGAISPATGMVLNLRTVDRIIHEEVISRFDHRFINLEVPGFERKNPTCENLVLAIWNLLEPRFRAAGAALHRLRLHESRDLYAELERESPRP